MLMLFQRKRAAPVPSALPAEDEKGKGLLWPVSAATLLATPRRQRLLEHIWQRTSLSRRQYASLYLAPLERYAELVQQFPASESHHHAYPGGMLDHGLEIAAYALKLRQSRLLPSGTTPEDQAAQSEAWTAATAYAALLHDIGKIAVDLQVELADGSTWHPWHGPLRQHYRFRYRQNRAYRLHCAAAGLLYHQLLDREILDWLSGYTKAWSALLYVLAGQYEQAGALGELVLQADRASVAQALGGDPARAMAAPKRALQRKLLEGLRYLLKEDLKLNQPQASDGWLTQDALWLVSKTVSDKLRAHLLAQGIDGIPASNIAVFNVLQEHGMLQPTPGGKAIWRATITSETGWSQTLTFLKLAPALIWDTGERPPPFAGTVSIPQREPEPADHDTLVTLPTTESPPSDTAAGSPPVAAASGITATDPVRSLLEMLDHAPSSSLHSTESPVTPTPAPPAMAEANARRMTAPSGEHFIAWLRDRIHTRKLFINDAKALVHTVADTAYLVSPSVFQRYAQEYPHVAALARADGREGWQWVQKQFEKLALHRKQASGLNIWTCEVTGPRKSRRLHGYLLAHPGVLFPEVPPHNPYLRLLSETAECGNSIAADTPSANPKS